MAQQGYTSRLPAYASEGSPIDGYNAVTGSITAELPPLSYKRRATQIDQPEGDHMHTVPSPSTITAKLQRCPRRRPASLAGSLIAIGLLVSGCGGASTSSGPPNAGVANMGRQSLAFAACMRSRGVSGYPDPRVADSGNGVQVTISPGTANPDSPAFRAADRACHHLLPGLVSTSPSSGQNQEQDLKFADCMRSHGVPGFPDADRDGAFTLPSTINQQAPQFERATTACTNTEPSSLSILTQSPPAS